jgi:sulfide:quinone oxidoreductase
MAHVVVLGAGIGGLTAAYDMKEQLRSGDTLTVISENPYWQFTPSNPWVAVSWRTREDITFDLAPYLERKGIKLIATAAKRVHPDKNQVELADGKTVAYDFLIIATGPKLAFDEVPGAGPHGGHTHSVCTVNHAVDAAADWNQFIKDPGHIVVGAMAGASCYGPAYEFALIMDTDLRRRKIRSKVPMTFVTAEPYVGHLGLGGVGDSKGMLESVLRDKHIKWICNAKVTKVEAGKMFVAEHNFKGEVIKEHELPFKYSMMLPAFKGIDAVFGIEGLTNPRGFITADNYQRNAKFPNIFSVGVCVAIPPVEPTPVPTGAPKTGYMIETMVTATVHNIRNVMDGKEPDQKATWNAVCLADFGDNGAAFVAIPQIPPRNVSWFKKGKWVHLAKIGFEKYFIRKMKSGETEPVYERYMLKLMGVTRLSK